MFQALRNLAFFVLAHEDERNLGGSHDTNWTCCCTQVKKHGKPRVQTLDATCSAGCLEDGTLVDVRQRTQVLGRICYLRCDDEWRSLTSS